MQTPPQFTIVLRGYQREAVDTLLQQAAEALATGEEIRRVSVRAALLRHELPVRLRGYDRKQVDIYLSEVAARLSS